MNKFFCAFILVLGLASCSSTDDDAGSLPVIVTNEFCFGPDAAGAFSVAGAFNTPVTEIRPDVFLTRLSIYGDGLELNDTQELEGSGALINLSFYGNRNISLQNGTYRIGDTDEVGNVAASFVEEFDLGQLGSSLPLEEGFIAVSDYASGFAIEINGTDPDGNEFHGIFLGNVTEIF